MTLRFLRKETNYEELESAELETGEEEKLSGAAEWTIGVYLWVCVRVQQQQ